MGTVPVPPVGTLTGAFRRTMVSVGYKAFGGSVTKGSPRYTMSPPNGSDPGPKKSPGIGVVDKL